MMRVDGIRPEFSRKTTDKVSNVRLRCFRHVQKRNESNIIAVVMEEVANPGYSGQHFPFPCHLKHLPCLFVDCVSTYIWENNCHLSSFKVCGCFFLLHH